MCCLLCFRIILKSAPTISTRSSSRDQPSLAHGAPIREGTCRPYIPATVSLKALLVYCILGHIGDIQACSQWVISRRKLGSRCTEAKKRKHTNSVPLQSLTRMPQERFLTLWLSSKDCVVSAYSQTRFRHLSRLTRSIMFFAWKPIIQAEVLERSCIMAPRGLN